MCIRDSLRALQIAILGDLQGPKIRIGDLPAPRELADGTDLVLVPEGHERGDEVPVTYDRLAEDLHVGDRLLINDGLIDLIVLEVEKPRVIARVLHGGETVSYTHLRAHETPEHLVCRL